MVSTCLLLLSAAVGSPPGADAMLRMFSYATPQEASRHWFPQFGSQPIRVETLPEGGSCLALDAVFDKANARACWDWRGKADLSQCGRLSFDISAVNGDLSGTFGIYFETAGGWHAKFWSTPIPETWITRSFDLGSFGREGDPEGWNNITSFRFSVWSSGAGKAVYRLRNAAFSKRDPAENLLKNGSFEIVSGGLPYGWSSGHWGVGGLPWVADMDLWRAHWRLDRKTTKHGSTSLRIDNTPELPLLGARSVWVTPRATTGTCVLSAWLKSDRDGLPATLSCGGVSTSVDVGREWTQAVLRDVPPGKRTQVSLTPDAPGTLWIDAVQLQAAPDPTPDFHPRHDDEAIAAREELVDWSPPPRVTSVATGRQTTGPVQRAGAAIDENGRFLLDGKPYVQHSFGLEFVSDLDVLNAVARTGFRDVCIQIRESITTQRLTEIFDRSASLGLRVIPWLDGRMTRERFAEHITTLKNHPALLCWYVYDEPSGERFAEADARVVLAKKLDPDRPAYVNYLSRDLEDQTGDIYSTDVYPIPHSSPMEAINAVRVMKAAAEPKQRPVWMWLQGTGYAYWMDREPSPRELSCMAYGSLIEGASGIYYFAQFPRSRACLDEMRALCVEVDAVAPAISSLEPAPQLTSSDPRILCKAYAKDGNVFVLTVNVEQTGREAQFTARQAGDEVEVLFEGRTLPSRDGAWKDRFGPYERHVYRLRGAARSADHP